MTAIRSFRDEYTWLSNMYLTPVTLKVEDDEWVFPSAENAYQATKSNSIRDWQLMQRLTPGRSKRAGRQVNIRPNWDELKLPIMTEIVTLKFNQNQELMRLLILTGSREIIEENTWGDTYWGKCNGKGENNLGKILMNIRSSLNTAKK